MIRWVEYHLEYWAQRARISGTKPTRQSVRSTPQPVMLGPILLPVFTNSLDDLMECTFSKFADNSKLAVGICQRTREGMSAIRRNLQGLEKWADRNLINLIKSKCKLLHLGWSNFVQQDLAVCLCSKDSQPHSGLLLVTAKPAEEGE